MVSIGAVLKIILFGGAADGGILSIENHIEKVTVEDNTYADTFVMDNEGRSVFYCAKGPGRMRKAYVKKLFKDEDIF